MSKIDVLSDDVLTLHEAAKLLKSSSSTLLRFIADGRPGPDGEPVRLEAVRLGAKWITSRAAIRDFVAATTPRQLVGSR